MNGARVQLLHRSRRDIPASRAIKSSSDGQAYRNHVPNRFVPIRANVLVEGPKRLRAHVLELLRAMPPPSVHLGDIKVPQRQYYVHGADPTSSAG